MKTLIILILVLHLIFDATHGQTHLGTGSGTSGAQSSYFGYYAGNASTTSSAHNSFMGAYSGRNTTSGYKNTAMGFGSLNENVSGRSNTVFGADALINQVDGNENTAIGRYALRDLIDSEPDYYNLHTGHLAYGYKAASSHLRGIDNTAVGSMALETTDSSNYATAIGFSALGNHLGPYRNTATGAYASQETRGVRSAAFGSYSLNLGGSGFDVDGVGNSAFGFKALYRAEDPLNCIAKHNTAFGAYAGFGNSPICTLENTTAIGYSALVTASNQIRLGNTSVTSIGGQVSWSILSDGRFKKDLQNDIVGLEFINQLNPVSYSIDKSAFDEFLGIQEDSEFKSIESRTVQKRQVGFVAQEVEASLKKSRLVNSLAAIPQHDRDPYTIRYAEFVVPLVKAVQELAEQAVASQKEIATLEETLSLYERDALTNNNEQTNDDLNRVTEIKAWIPETSTSVNIVIYSTEGKQLKVIPLAKRGMTSLSIPHNDLPTGKYYYAIIAEEVIVEAKRFIVQ